MRRETLARLAVLVLAMIPCVRSGYVQTSKMARVRGEVPVGPYEPALHRTIMVVDVVSAIL